MFADRVFKVTFLISLIAHGIILFRNPNLAIFSADKKEQKLEVSYVKPPKEAQAELKTPKPKDKEPFLKLPQKISIQKVIPPPFIDKENIFKDSDSRIHRLDATLSKPMFINPDVISVKKKITLPPIDMTKINNPSYISYYQIVREKIKRCAYQNYTGQETGEVTISFAISNDGYLKELRLVEEKSSSSAYLKQVALRSVKDASSFPNFPKELDYPLLSFNLTITFEIE